MVKWSGWLIVFFGAAHTLGAFTVEGAARYVGEWFTGALWHEDLAAMSPAGSALWLTMESFGIPLVLIGLTVVWMGRRGIAPPLFLPWALIAWTAIDAVVLPFTPWPLMLLANVLLIMGIRRERVRG